MRQPLSNRVNNKCFRNEVETFSFLNCYKLLSLLIFRISLCFSNGVKHTEKSDKNSSYVSMIAFQNFKILIKHK